MSFQPLQEVIDVCHRYGWNGVENSKILWVFIESQFEELQELRQKFDALDESQKRNISEFQKKKEIVTEIGTLLEEANKLLKDL